MTEIKLASLSPENALKGRVTGIELAGAFVDVGAEVKGFLHISRLQQGNVNRIEDVLSIGQEVEVWVSRVDPVAERLELTMLRPVRLKWGQVQTGMNLQGEVTRIEPFGAFVEIGAERPGLVHVSEISHDYVNDPREQLKVGQAVTVMVLEVDRKKKQIRLSMKAARMQEEIEEEVEQFPTAMEVALRQAMGTSTPKPASEEPKAKPGKRRVEQEDLLARTLSRRLRTSSGESVEQEE